MKVSGTSMLHAPRDAVWRALNDPAVLVATIPGCQRLEVVGEDAYTMTIAAGVGSIKGVYAGQVRLSDQQEPGSFHLHAQGAGAPGTIGADVHVLLADGADGGTELTYEADATVGGMIGGVGQRMLTGVSKKMAAEFFGNVDSVLVGATTSADGRTGEGAPTVDGSGRRATEERGWMGGAPSPGSPAVGTDATPGAAPALHPPAAPPSPGSPAVGTDAGRPVGRVFTAPAATGSAGDLGFALGVAVGAAAALGGALVGGWLSRRRN